MKEYMKDLDFERSRFMLFCDKESVIYLTKHSTFNSKPKHISKMYHQIRMIVDHKSFKVEEIHIDDNPLDMLKKVVVEEKHAYYRTLVGMNPVNGSST
ncbi:unnamed protein product [Withania somnifera]